jgi:glycosyltransferase EpsE
MKISVLMPLRDNKKYLEESIKSILNQTYQNFELIICDDGSTDNIYEVLNKYKNHSKIKIIKNETNLGIAKTLNKMIEVTSGDCFTQHDSDDISLPTKFEKQIKEMKEGSNFVVTQAKLINSDGAFMGDSVWLKMANSANEELIKKDSINNCYVVNGTAMWSRNVFNKIGYRDEVMLVAQEYNYWIRLLKFFEVRKIFEVLFYHRKHQDSHRTKYKENYKKVDYFKLAKERAKTHPTLGV